MSEIDPHLEVSAELTLLKSRTDALENALREARDAATQQAIQAELRVEAVRSGMIDLDGLRLLDSGGLQLAEDGTLADAKGMIGRLRQDKPWLFAAKSSSSHSEPPSSVPLRAKHATDMSVEEWRAARADLLKRR